MDIKNAEYKKAQEETEVSSILAVIDGLTCSIPLVEGNAEYDEIMKRVKEGTLTIKDAD
tara:strand:+ start:1161 stop:1337 length:177 start_codon:yes stop_codon:yes gene_type:complete